MYKGYWYDVVGRKRRGVKPVPLDFPTLEEAIVEALEIIPDASLIVKNTHLDWGLLSIDGNKRMLISSKEKPSV